MTDNRAEKRNARTLAAKFNVKYTHALRLIRKQVYVVYSDGAVIRGTNWNAEDSLD